MEQLNQIEDAVKAAIARTPISMLGEILKMRVIAIDFLKAKNLPSVFTTLNKINQIK